MTKPKKRSHHKKPAAKTRPQNKSPHAMEAAPETLHAAVDREGRVRFSDASVGAVESFVGKLKKFYRVAVYDLREPQRYPNKAAVKAAKERT